MLYLAIPAYNEVATIGVLLWRLRTVLAEFPREYEVVVYDDASTDETASVAEQYERAMPVTVVRGERHLGYAGAVDALLRFVANHTRYPRRDAVLLLQGDFTDPPGIVPEFARRFEGGADLIVGERRGVADAPTAVRRLFSAANWALRPFVRIRGLRDLTGSMRLVRIAALRDAIRAAGPQALLAGDSWTANADLLLQLIPHARRLEVVPVEPTYGVRLRDTRRVAMRDALAVLKWGWRARHRRVEAVVSLDAVDGEGRRSRPQPKRRDEPELSVERLREKIRVRDGSGGVDGEPESARRDRRRDRPGRSDRPERDRSDRERPDRSARRERGAREERVDAPREERKAEPRERAERPARTDRPDRQARPDRGPSDRGSSERGPSGRGRRSEGRPSERSEETPRPAGSPSAATLGPLDDPFAGPPRVRGTEPPVPAALQRPGRDDAVDPAGAEDEDDELDDGVDEGTALDADPAAGRPKRRRRRSRRGRKRRDGDPTTADAAPAEGPDPLAFLHYAQEESEGIASTEEASDDPADSALGDDPAAPRRPRGRRGRRGGARRSRGRRDRSEGGGDGGGDTGGDAGGDAGGDGG